MSQAAAEEAINWYKLNVLTRETALALLHAVAQLLYATRHAALRQSLAKAVGVQASTATNDVLDVCAAVIRRCARDRRWAKDALPLVGVAGPNLLRPVQRELAESNRFDVTMLCDLLVNGNLGLKPNDRGSPPARTAAVKALRVAILHNGVLGIADELNHNRDVALSGQRFAAERDRLRGALTRAADAAQTIGAFRFDGQGKVYVPFTANERAGSRRLQSFARAREQFDAAWRAVESGSYSLANVERMRYELSSFSFLPLIIGLTTTFLSSLFAIDFLLKYFYSNGLKLFIIYRFIFGIVILLNL